MGYNSILKSHHIQLSIPIPLTSKIMPDSLWFKMADNKRDWGVVRNVRIHTFLEIRKKTSTAGSCMRNGRDFRKKEPLGVQTLNTQVWSILESGAGVGVGVGGRKMDKSRECKYHSDHGKDAPVSDPQPALSILTYLYLCSFKHQHFIYRKTKIEDTLKNNYTNFLRKSGASKMGGSPQNNIRIPILVFGPSSPQIKVCTYKKSA